MRTKKVGAVAGSGNTVDKRFAKSDVRVSMERSSSEEALPILVVFPVMNVRESSCRNNIRLTMSPAIQTQHSTLFSAKLCDLSRHQCEREGRVTRPVMAHHDCSCVSIPHSRRRVVSADVEP